MLATLLTEIGSRPALAVTLNTLGEPEERPAYRDALVAYSRQRRRAGRGLRSAAWRLNPLRILDSKNPDVQALVARAPVIHDHLGDASRARFAKVREVLGSPGGRPRGRRAARARPRLLHGTIFEIKVTAGDLGAQNTVCGGGRYDRLVESLGGPKTPALGFGLGVERALLAMPEPARSFEPPARRVPRGLDAAALAYLLPLAHRCARRASASRSSTGEA